MANYIGAKLSRLIQQRAYSAGEIERLIELEVELPATISKARKDMRAAKQAPLFSKNMLAASTNKSSRYPP